MKIDFRKLAASIILCQAAGIIGAFFTTSAIPTWYSHLAKPEFSPPNWVFGPVWFFLYLTMGISLYLIWIVKNKKREKSNAIRIFSAQLFLNAIWSIIFFGLKSPGAAFFEIMLLWISIILTIVTFKKLSKTAAFLLLPYALWVTFAAVLNYSIWIMN